MSSVGDLLRNVLSLTPPHYTDDECAAEILGVLKHEDAVFPESDKRTKWLRGYFYAREYRHFIVSAIDDGRLSPDFDKSAFLNLVCGTLSLREHVTPRCLADATSRTPAPEAGPQFAGLKCSDIHVAVRVDMLNVKRINTRGFGTDYSLADVGMVAGDAKYRALMAVSKSTLDKNMIGWPADLDESTLSRFCTAFREETGVLGRLLSRKGKTMVSNCGKMTWSSENKSPAPQERSNQQALIDRTKAPRNPLVEVCDKLDPWSLEYSGSPDDEDNEEMDNGHIPSWKRNR